MTRFMTLFALISLSAAAWASSGRPSGAIKRLTILATNDIHGGIEPAMVKGHSIGGLAEWAGIVSSIRQGVAASYGSDGGVLVLDAGDQFQGTLISNYNEGELVFRAMNEVGYDAAVPGNHDYDFGPKGWLDDQVNAGNPDKNPRSVIEGLAAMAKFPLLSANTYLTSSLVDSKGGPVPVSGIGCEPLKPERKIDWSSAKRPAFLQPYVLKTVAGVRVAVIGLDNHSTPLTTTASNVSDLCFRGELETYNELRSALDGQADVFILVLHDGNVKDDLHVTDLARSIAETRPNAVHAIVAGHTHAENETQVLAQDGSPVPIIQSRSGGEFFGRIDLQWDSARKALAPNGVAYAAAIQIDAQGCAKKAASYCRMKAGQLEYEGVPVVASSAISKLAADERARMSPIATRAIGQADQEVRVERVNESSLGDALADDFRNIAARLYGKKIDIAFMNTGGIRAPLPAGTVTYEDFFRVLPMSNHGVVLSEMGWDQLEGLLEKSIQTCGEYGALTESGLRVEFSHDCKSNSGKTDPDAKLLRVSTASGEVLYDSSNPSATQRNRKFQTATLDFLAAGGSGYKGFEDLKTVYDLGILREALTDAYLKSPAHWDGKTDGRWKLVP